LPEFIVPQPQTNDDRRQDPRFDTKFRAVLIESDVFGKQVQIVNIARMGFLAQTRLSYESGSEISLDLPGLGHVSAMVVWCANGLLGGRFRDAIDEYSFGDFLASLA
jgi:PilZ domain